MTSRTKGEAGTVFKGLPSSSASAEPPRRSITSRTPISRCPPPLLHGVTMLSIHTVYGSTAIPCADTRWRKGEANIRRRAHLVWRGCLTLACWIHPRGGGRAHDGTSCGGDEIMTEMEPDRGGPQQRWVPLGEVIAHIVHVTPCLPAMDDRQPAGPVFCWLADLEPDGMASLCCWVRVESRRMAAWSTKRILVSTGGRPSPPCPGLAGVDGTSRRIHGNRQHM
jgi:hypothetical protein